MHIALTVFNAAVEEAVSGEYVVVHTQATDGGSAPGPRRRRQPQCEGITSWSGRTWAWRRRTPSERASGDP